MDSFKKLKLLVFIFVFGMLPFQNCADIRSSEEFRSVQSDGASSTIESDSSNLNSDPNDSTSNSNSDSDTSSDNGGVTGNNGGSNSGGTSDGGGNSGNETPAPAPMDDVRMYIFGHSLINHEHTPAPTEEKKVPHWLALLSQSANQNYGVDGQYGFLTQHANFDNIQPQWGFQQAQSLWTDENAPFSSVDYNVILSTPANFIQYQGPDQDYFNQPGVTPISATLQIFDQSLAAHPGVALYVYENWPDMGGYGSFPGGVDINRYHNDTISGNFHNWFLQYHDALRAARPNANIKMIPVGPIISRLLRDTALRDIPLTDLYEDDAPHGQPTIYFLASLVTYMAVYQTPAPSGFNPPPTVHSLVRNNYSMVVATIWNHLQNFNDQGGNSRAF